MVSFLQNSWLALLLAALIAYVLGSVNFAIIITRFFSGNDIRSFGSGNAGATNVLRSQGKLPAALTFVGDLLKSMLSVYLGGLLLQNVQLLPAAADEMELLMYDPQNLGLVGAYLAGVFCILGHMYPVFFGFRGGKGVMTTFGMTLLLENVMEDIPALVTDIVAGVGDPRLRLCLDVGHAQTSVSQLPIEDWICGCAPWISHVHLHNNRRDWDLHNPLGEGDIPMEKPLDLLAQLCPDCTYTIENLTAAPSIDWLLDRNYLQ